MEQDKQHVQLPNNMTATKELTPKDLLVYVSIKRFMNKDTWECFPSLDTIVKVSGVSKPTVRKTIEKLKQLNYISVIKKGRSNVYKFSSYKNFEPFSYSFLDKQDLSPEEKALIIVEQQYMFKDQDGIGKITYTDLELSEKINMSYNTIVKYHNSLREKGYLDLIKTKAKDSNTGLVINEKIYHLDELGQAVVFILQNHEERIGDNENKINVLEKQIKILMNDSKEKDKEIEKLKLKLNSEEIIL